MNELVVFLTVCDMKNMVIIEMRRKGGFVREMRSR